MDHTSVRPPVAGRPAVRRSRIVLTATTVLALVLSGCTGGTVATNDADDPSALRVLAGSEIRDMEPVLQEAEKAIGVHVQVSYAGTLDGAEQVASGTAGQSYDATWFSSNRYLGLLPKGNQALSASSKIMASPVVLGVRASSAQRLGWDRTAPTWAQIAEAAKSGRFTYGMTNPASSNSGFSALVGVATALSGSGKAIDAGQITGVTPKLTEFFSGQKLTSGSSGWLADRFAQQAGSARGIDGLVNYESVLLDLNARGALPEKLTLVYPSDGVVSADYPLSALASATPEKKQAYTKLVDWLRTPEAQKLLMERTHRRPVVPGVPLAAEFGRRLLVELPFPAQRSAADGLIAAYLNTASRPSQTVYVLDTSGSMGGERLDQLKRAFATLSGQDTTRVEGFTRFRNRERVTLIPFSDHPLSFAGFEVPEKDPQAELSRLAQHVQDLEPGGGTAIYDSLLTAYDRAAAEASLRPESFTTIVLMTDGEKTVGRSLEDFEQAFGGLPEATRAIPTFTVLFGDSDVTEMQKVAQITHGKVFDARTSSLADVFKEIRGYQ